MQLYDDSPRRGTGVFDTSHSSEEVRYDAVAPMNVCVFSRPLQMCEANEEFTSSYDISTSAL